MADELLLGRNRRIATLIRLKSDERILMVEWVDIYQRLLGILDVRNLGDVSSHALRLVVIITIRLLPGLFGR